MILIHIDMKLNIATTTIESVDGCCHISEVKINICALKLMAVIYLSECRTLPVPDFINIIIFQ